MRLFLRWLGNPSLQFFAALFAAPLCGIAGEAAGGRGSLTELAGWFITCLLISVTTLRSYRHEREQLPPGRLFLTLKPHNPTMSRYLAGVATLWFFATGGAVCLGAAILLRLLFGLFG